MLFVALIFYFLLKEGLPALGEVKLSMLFSTRWYPIEGYFGILPLLGGSGDFRRTLAIVANASLIAVPSAVVRGALVMMKKSAEVTGSGASRGVDTERNAKGGAVSTLVSVSVKPGGSLYTRLKMVRGSGT